MPQLICDLIYYNICGHQWPLQLHNGSTMRKRCSKVVAGSWIADSDPRNEANVEVQAEKCQALRLDQGLGIKVVLDNFQVQSHCKSSERWPKGYFKDLIQGPKLIVCQC